MNLHDQVIHRCIHAACARPLPRRVNFCPFCGTGQHDGVMNPMHVARPAPPTYHAPAAPPVTMAAPVVLDKPAPPAPAPIAPPPPPMAAPRVEPSLNAPAPAAPPPVPPETRSAARSGPPRREPVRLRYWLMALGVLWLIWIYAKPSANKIEDRIESAVVASKECRLNDAQSELIALRLTKATPEQLKRLQSAINTESATCEKKRQRADAWAETTAAVDAALKAGDPAKAQARLTQFTRRWKEDDDTRKLKEQITVQREAAAAVAAAAPRQPSASQSARNLIDEAERAIKEGNYKAASDKLETCITMVDEGNRECAAFKVHADRLQADMLRCLGQRREWYDDRCH